jgi:hypothetical protein
VDAGECLIETCDHRADFIPDTERRIKDETRSP